MGDDEEKKDLGELAKIFVNYRNVSLAHENNQPIARGRFLTKDIYKKYEVKSSEEIQCWEAVTRLTGSERIVDWLDFKELPRMTATMRASASAARTAWSGEIGAKGSLGAEEMKKLPKEEIWTLQRLANESPEEAEEIMRGAVKKEKKERAQSVSCLTEIEEKDKEKEGEKGVLDHLRRLEEVIKEDKEDRRKREQREAEERKEEREERKRREQREAEEKEKKEKRKTEEKEKKETRKAEERKQELQMKLEAKEKRIAAEEKRRKEDKDDMKQLMMTLCQRMTPVPSQNQPPQKDDDIKTNSSPQETAADANEGDSQHEEVAGILQNRENPGGPGVGEPGGPGTVEPDGPEIGELPRTEMLPQSQNPRETEEEDENLPVNDDCIPVERLSKETKEGVEKPVPFKGDPDDWTQFKFTFELYLAKMEATTRKRQLLLLRQCLGGSESKVLNTNIESLTEGGVNVRKYWKDMETRFGKTEYVPYEMDPINYLANYVWDGRRTTFETFCREVESRARKWCPAVDPKKTIGSWIKEYVPKELRTKIQARDTANDRESPWMHVDKLTEEVERIFEVYKELGEEVPWAETWPYFYSRTRKTTVDPIKKFGAITQGRGKDWSQKGDKENRGGYTPNFDSPNRGRTNFYQPWNGNRGEP